MGHKQIPFESRHFKLYQITDGVFAAIALNGGAAVGNAGILDLGNRTLICNMTRRQGKHNDRDDLQKPYHAKYKGLMSSQP